MKQICRSWGWLRNKCYEWSTHTEIEKSLRWAKAQGRQSGLAYCPRCAMTKLVEIEPGLFNCPNCKSIDTGSHFAIPHPYKAGIMARNYPDKADTQQINAVIAKNGPVYQQRLTRRLDRLPEKEV